MEDSPLKDSASEPLTEMFYAKILDDAEFMTESASEAAEDWTMNERRHLVEVLRELIDDWIDYEWITDRLLREVNR